jgi:hypothetical protein
MLCCTSSESYWVVTDQAWCNSSSPSILRSHRPSIWNAMTLAKLLMVTTLMGDRSVMTKWVLYLYLPLSQYHVWSSICTVTEGGPERQRFDARNCLRQSCPLYYWPMNTFCGRGYFSHELLISLDYPPPFTAVRSRIHGNFHLAFAFVLSFLPFTVDYIYHCGARSYAARRSCNRV